MPTIHRQRGSPSQAQKRARSSPLHDGVSRPRTQQRPFREPRGGEGAAIAASAAPDPATWTRLSADIRYFFAARVAIGFGLLYENQERLDFATIDGNGSVGFTAPTDTARIDYLGGLVTGYSPRPYRGVTTFVRLLDQF